MTEEVTYANLKFENSHELDNIKEPEDTKEKGPPSSSRSCSPVVLILFTLCLALLMALVTLAVFCQNCVLCPANWKWEGGDACYYYSEEKKSSERSRQFCSSQNSTLLLIKEAAKQEMVKKFPTKSYWIGLTFRDEQTGWYWADNTPLTEEQKSWVKYPNSLQGCAYYYYDSISTTRCKETLHYICEKPVIQLQRGNNHWQENWFVRPK
ncbi:CD209 antigen-like protein A isoform X3 [Strix uralensis]|uniref:CD209 antigen-like protein A isoform X3 n=1 Tax=Strix uralensis TaxID=36305 RepID=UPI003DA71C3C